MAWEVKAGLVMLAVSLVCFIATNVNWKYIVRKVKERK